MSYLYFVYGKKYSGDYVRVSKPLEDYEEVEKIINNLDIYTYHGYLVIGHNIEKNQDYVIEQEYFETNKYTIKKGK